MDKQDASVRRYAPSAPNCWARDHPNTAFKANANTEVTTDILFLQKREQELSLETVSAGGLRWLESRRDRRRRAGQPVFSRSPGHAAGYNGLDKKHGHGNRRLTLPASHSRAKAWNNA